MLYPAFPTKGLILQGGKVKDHTQKAWSFEGIVSKKSLPELSLIKFTVYYKIQLFPQQAYSDNFTNERAAIAMTKSLTATSN